MPRKNDFDIFGGFFDDSFFNESRQKEIMKTDIKEGENEYTLEIEMPGIKKENVKIELSNFGKVKKINHGSPWFYIKNTCNRFCKY